MSDRAVVERYAEALANDTELFGQLLHPVWRSGDTLSPGR